MGTSSVFASNQPSALESNMSIGFGIEPVFSMGNIFKSAQVEGSTFPFEDKSTSIGLRMVLPEVSFSITEQFKVGVKLFGQYNVAYDQQVATLKQNDKTYKPSDQEYKLALGDGKYSVSGYSFGIAPQVEFSFYNSEDLSVGVALGPVFQYNATEAEPTDTTINKNKLKSHWMSLDASLGLKIGYNISESVQLRAGVFYETANLAKFGSKISGDKLTLDGDFGIKSAGKKPFVSSLTAAQDADRYGFA